MEPNPILQGLTITVVGLLLAFLAMSLFILTMVVLKKLFPYREEAEEAESEGEEAPVMSAQSDAEGEVIAAIAVALSQMRAAGQSETGSALLAGRGTWWVANRMAAHRDAGLQRKYTR